MQEELISFETAKLAKEKGFNLDCRYAYDEIENTIDSSIFYNGNEFFTLKDIENAKNNTDSNYYLIPTQSLLQKWLREKHNIHIMVNWVYKLVGKGVHWYYTVKGIGLIDNNILPYKDIRMDSFEEALEAGLQEALKLIKN